MKLPAFSGKKRSINLLPKDAFESSGLGVVLSWALTFGKWAVIITQLIVMSAFLWRFVLDRQLTDLRKEIEKQKAIITSYSQVENDFLVLQTQLKEAKLIVESQQHFVDTLALVQSVTPPDVWYERLTVNDESVAITAYSSTLPGFSRFLSAIQKNPEFRTVNVSTIEDGGAQGAQLRFDLTLGVGEAKNAK